MFLSLLRKRRSIRKFQKKAVEEEKVGLLIEAALRSPSSRGLNPWEFICVTDKRLLAELARAKPHGSAFLRNAPLGIVVCANPDTCDVWVEDSAIAAILIQLAAESLGLASCWIQIRERMHDEALSAGAHVSRLLGIPDRIAVESIIAVGYAAEQLPPHEKEELDYGKVHLNRY